MDNIPSLNDYNNALAQQRRVASTPRIEYIHADTLEPVRLTIGVAGAEIAETSNTFGLRVSLYHDLETDRKMLTLTDSTDDTIAVDALALLEVLDTLRNYTV